MAEKLIGIIGGSGLYKMDGMEVVEEKKSKTPFGEPSDNFIIGRLDGFTVAFLSRHGRGHRVNPSEINYRANIYAFKTLGVERIVSVSAVGSMKEEIDRGHIVIVNQLIDRTRRRPYTFFENGIVAHVAFADPMCHRLVEILYQGAKKAGAAVHKEGTYVCIEGPTFSTRAESKLFRSWGVDVIGMTSYQEAKLAREAEICYATMALVTDYDCWHTGEDDVNVASIMEVMRNNVEIAQKILRLSIPVIASDAKGCCCNGALEHAIMTDPKVIPADVKKRLEPIVGKYLKRK